MAKANPAAHRHDIDPITFSVVWNKLQYLAEQVGEKVLYSTQSFVTALARDLGQSILDVNGKIVVAASSAPAIPPIVAPVRSSAQNTPMRSVNSCSRPSACRASYRYASDAPERKAKPEPQMR